jgi:hypothetical protein
VGADQRRWLMERQPMGVGVHGKKGGPMSTKPIADRKPSRPKNYVVANYWLDFYCADHCTLCGNSGFIDTTGICTPAGLHVGRVNFCICPNGQLYRAGSAVSPSAKVAQ